MLSACLVQSVQRTEEDTLGMTPDMSPVYMVSTPLTLNVVPVAFWMLVRVSVTQSPLLLLALSRVEQ